MIHCSADTASICFLGAIPEAPVLYFARFFSANVDTADAGRLWFTFGRLLFARRDRTDPEATDAGLGGTVMANFLSEFLSCLLRTRDRADIARAEDAGRLRLIGDEGGRIMRVDLLAYQGDRAAAFAGDPSCLRAIVFGVTSSIIFDAYPVTAASGTAVADSDHSRLKSRTGTVTLLLSML